MSYVRPMAVRAASRSAATSPSRKTRRGRAASSELCGYRPGKQRKENPMSFRVLGILVLCTSALGTPCFGQANRGLTPVAPQELNRFIGATVYGRARAKLGIVTGANRDSGTIKVIAWQG